MGERQGEGVGRVVQEIGARTADSLSWRNACHKSYRKISQFRLSSEITAADKAAVSPPLARLTDTKTFSDFPIFHNSCGFFRAQIIPRQNK